jgi:hypothetical protein
MIVVSVGVISSEELQAVLSRGEKADSIAAQTNNKGRAIRQAERIYYQSP